MKMTVFLMLVSCSLAHAIRPIDGPFVQEGPRYHEALKGGCPHPDRLQCLRSYRATETQILDWNGQSMRMGQEEFLLRTFTDLIILEESGDPALMDAEPAKLISHRLWHKDENTVSHYLRLADLVVKRCHLRGLDELLVEVGSAMESAPLNVRVNTAALYAQILSLAHSRRHGPCAGSLTVAPE